jgi:ribosomal protein S18 acetylase RimI-like enzyme
VFRHEDGHVALRSPHMVLNNALLLDTADLDEVIAFFGAESQYAVWTREGRLPAAASARLLPDVRTQPMVLDLGRLRGGGPDGDVQLDADPAVVAALNSVDASVLASVPGLRCAVAEGGKAGLAVQDVDGDVVLSFVATQVAARGQGLASRLVLRALHDAAERGAHAAVLQATPMAVGLYARLGFRRVGTLQEWAVG